MKISRWLVLVALAAPLSLAACGSSAGDAAPPEVTGTISIAGTTLAPTQAAPSSVPDTSGSSNLAACETTSVSGAEPKSCAATHVLKLVLCSTSQLAISAGKMASADGDDGYPLLFQNTGAALCVLRGSPTVSGTGSGGVQLTAQQTLSGKLGGVEALTSPSEVILEPGIAASAMVEAASSQASGSDAPCQTLTSLSVAPPGSQTSTEVALPTPLIVCGDFQAHPAVFGKTGRIIQ